MADNGTYKWSAKADEGMAYAVGYTDWKDARDAALLAAQNAGWTNIQDMGGYRVTPSPGFEPAPPTSYTKRNSPVTGAGN